MISFDRTVVWLTLIYIDVHDIFCVLGFHVRTNRISLKRVIKKQKQSINILSVMQSTQVINSWLSCSQVSLIVRFTFDEFSIDLLRIFSISPKNRSNQRKKIHFFESNSKSSSNARTCSHLLISFLLTNLITLSWIGKRIKFSIDVNSKLIADRQTNMSTVFQRSNRRLDLARDWRWS